MDQSLIKDSYQLIKKDLAVEGIFDDGLHPSVDRLIEWLTPEISRMLREDFAGLLNALYRIDVNEEKVTAILELEAPDHLAKSLAQLVISRQIAKAETRRKYTGLQ